MVFASLLAATLALQSTPATPPKPATDARVDQSKVTTLPEPSVTAVANLVRSTPPQPVHRIASRAADVPTSQATYDKARAAMQRGLAYLAKLQSPNGAFFE